MTRIKPLKSLVLLALLALGLSAVGLALAGSASAQFPSMCLEYDDPCIGGTDEAGEHGGLGPGGGGHNPFGPGGDGDRGGTGDADGKLPFTGYPLTGMILLLLVLLAIGLTLRSGVALREKLAHRH